MVPIDGSGVGPKMGVGLSSKCHFSSHLVKSSLAI